MSARAEKVSGGVAREKGPGSSRRRDSLHRQRPQIEPGPFSRATPQFWTAVFALAFAIVALLLVWPLSSVFMASFLDNATREPTLDNYAQVLGRPFFLTSLVNSLIVGVGGMAGAMLLGIPLATLTTRYVIRGRNFLATLAVLALVSPPFIGAYAWIMMLGRNGFVRTWLEATLGLEVPSIYGFFGIILVFSFKFYPFVFLLATSSLKTINPAVEEAAEGLGAGPWRRFFAITLPLVLPAISIGALLTFVLSIADFGTPAIVGGKVRVLATTAYNLFTSEMGGNPGLASATSVVLIVLSLFVVFFQRWSTSKRNVAGSLMRKPVPRRLAPVRSAIAHLVCYAIVLVGSLPSLIVVSTSFRKTSGPVFQPGFGLDSYAKILHEVPHVITNSAVFSLTAVLLIVVVGTLIGYVVARTTTRWAGALDAALYIPYVVPGVVLGVAFVITFNTNPIEITGTATIVVLMLFIRRLPYAVRSSAAILKQIRGSIEEAAISLGASPARAFTRITLPLMLPGIIAGGLMSFITAINELSSSLILYVGRTMTMPVRIYQSVLDGEFGTAAALSTILLVTSGIAVYLVFRVSGRDESAFV